MAGIHYPADRVIIMNDWYNALYENGTLALEGKPEHTDAETLARLWPKAAIYEVPQDVYDEVLGGNGYPRALADFPLDRCERVREMTQ